MKPRAVVTKAMFVLALVLAMAGTARPVAADPITYDFETGAQGWVVGGFNPTWFLGTAVPGSVGQPLPSTWWIDPNTGNEAGYELSHVTSPLLTATALGMSINFDSYTSNEGGYPSFYDVEHVQAEINGGGFFDLHAFDPNLHNNNDQTFRNITYLAPVVIGDLVQFRFLYDTGDGCCGPGDIHGWAFDNVQLSDALDPTAVPEPSSMFLLGTGLLVAARRWRKRKTVA